MAFSLVASTTKSSTDANPTTTSSIDTTGADFLLVVGVWGSVFGGAWALTDSKSNTWSTCTTRTASDQNVRIAYCVPSSVGTGHTFSFGSGFGYFAISVSAWSGANASPFGAEGAGSSGSTFPGYTMTPGSVTPTEDNCLVIAGVNSSNSAATYTIDSGYTELMDSSGSGNARANKSAYLIQGTAAAVNPTLTFSDYVNYVGTSAWFKPAAAATGHPTMRRWGGVPYLGGQGIGQKGGGRGRMWGQHRSGLIVPRRFAA